MHLHAETLNQHRGPPPLTDTVTIGTRASRNYSISYSITVIPYSISYILMTMAMVSTGKSVAHSQTAISSLQARQQHASLQGGPQHKGSKPPYSHKLPG